MIVREVQCRIQHRGNIGEGNEHCAGKSYSPPALDSNPEHTCISFTSEEAVTEKMLWPFERMVEVKAIFGPSAFKKDPTANRELFGAFGDVTWRPESRTDGSIPQSDHDGCNSYYEALVRRLGSCKKSFNG